MSCTYCKDFDFKKTARDMSKAKQAYAKGGPVTEKVKGGPVTEKATGEKYPSREAMVKHESKETPRMQREELVERAKVVTPKRRSVPVAPNEPLIALKKGGTVPAPKTFVDSAKGREQARAQAIKQGEGNITFALKKGGHVKPKA